MARSKALKTPPSAEAELDRSAVKSLRKALAVLDVVAAAEHPLSIAEIALRAGIARPTAYRLVKTLVTDGHLIENTIDARISIGFAVLPLAASLLDRNRLRVEALPHLHTLAQQTGERVNLGILHRDRVLYLAGVEKPALPTIYSRFGKTVSAHCCSLGKAILAHLPENDVRALLVRQPLTAHTPNSITNLTSFMKELRETRERGYAVDRAEHVAGSYCVATTIFNGRNEPVGAIGLSGRALDALIKHKTVLRQTAELISHVL
jgi:DNA-binding IclR family transcriptional regulator